MEVSERTIGSMYGDYGIELPLNNFLEKIEIDEKILKKIMEQIKWKMKKNINLKRKY